MFALPARSVLRRLLCLLLALSLAVPALGLASPAGKPAGESDTASASVESVPQPEAEPPCPMHAAATSASAAPSAASTQAELADCCQHPAGLHQNCGDDCSSCAAGCSSPRPPAGLEALELSLANGGVEARHRRQPDRIRPDAPQPNLLRPPALG